MLHPIQILPASHRRTPRRGLELGCALTSHVFGPRRHSLIDLSPTGARVVGDGLEVSRDDRVLLEFAPPSLGRRVETLARVAHVAQTDRGVDVGLEFVGLAKALREDLTRALRGVPPPLPHLRKARKPAQLVWVEMLVTWEEDLGDRVNTFEVSERMATLDDGEFEIEALAPIMSAAAPAYQWRLA